MKVKSFLLVMMLLAFCELDKPNSLASQMKSLSELETLTKKCIVTKKFRECRVALSFAEVLQNQAASRGDFACQSRLLGLESDLIRIPFQSVRDQLVLEMLEVVKIFCVGM